jgi:hypothetical protein
MWTEVAMRLFQGATYTLILIVQHQGYITEARRAFAPLSGCPPPCIKVACNPSLGSTGALTSSLHGWRKTVQTFLVRHSQIKCIVAEEKQHLTTYYIALLTFHQFQGNKKYEAVK